MRQVIDRAVVATGQQLESVTSGMQDVTQMTWHMPADEAALRPDGFQAVGKRQTTHDMAKPCLSRSIDPKDHCLGAVCHEARLPGDALLMIAGATISARTQSSSLSISCTRQRGITIGREWGAKICWPLSHASYRPQ